MFRIDRSEIARVRGAVEAVGGGHLEQDLMCGSIGRGREFFGQ